MNMEILHYLAGPIIGAIIGYCTNYIAVKMLFRPHHEVYIGKFRLPFTPGLIPKRKNALASAVGHAVSNSLLTESDLSNMLLSEEVEASVTGMIMKQLRKMMKSTDRLSKVAKDFTGEELYDTGRTTIKETLRDHIMDALMAAEPGKLIASEGKKAVQKMLAGTMFAMFLHGETLDLIADELGNYAENYLTENGPDFIEKQIESEFTDIEETRVYQVGEIIMSHEEILENKVREIYRACIGKVAANIVSQFHIDRVIEDKIRAMDVVELEALVMSVMKHELGMIVNLGALIGFVLGLVNIIL